jgi:predicted acyltransferase
VFDNGAHPSIVMAGVVASIIFLDPAFAKTFREKALWALGYAAILGGAGYALSPFGIAKNAATPTWCLYCAAISTLLFLALYGLVDVKKVNAWAAPLKPAGSNTLLTYLLPDIIYVALGGYYFKILTEGLPGVFRGICFTACILGLSALLTRWKIRMQL